MKDKKMKIPKNSAIASGAIFLALSVPTGANATVLQKQFEFPAPVKTNWTEFEKIQFPFQINEKNNTISKDMFYNLTAHTVKCMCDPRCSCSCYVCASCK